MEQIIQEITDLRLMNGNELMDVFRKEVKPFFLCSYQSRKYLAFLKRNERYAMGCK